MTARALAVEFHAPAGLGYLAGAMTLRANAWFFQEPAPVTLAADIAARHLQAQHCSPNRLPEPDIYLVLQVAARLRAAGLLPATAEHAGENVAEAAAPVLAGGGAAAASFEQIGKIEAAEIEGHALGAATAGLCAAEAGSGAATRSASGTCVSFRRFRADVVGVVAELVVDFALLGIAEDVVGLRDRLEAFF